ncbi:MAG: zinc ABC transporter substrate-binding protein, partial [Myxococcales bacterium]|nr:zinc ABC transporter substrate-binding protein [Myxococcales bacterium]
MRALDLRLVASALAGATIFWPASPAGATLRVFSCESEWAALAAALGGDQVEAYSATSARQDVHYIQARPSLIAKLRRADLLICSGADLEIGWLPVLLRKASNAKVQPGQPGHVDVSKIVPMLDVPSRVDRSEGDIHPYGNPHTQTDPHNIALVATELSHRLERIDPKQAGFYRQRSSEFADRWQKAIASWEARAAPLRGMKIITHHVAWVYMAHWLGLEVVGHLEDKPGIPPTAGHLADLLAGLRDQKVELIVRSTYQPERPSEWLSGRSGIPTVVLP